MATAVPAGCGHVRQGAGGGDAERAVGGCHVVGKLRDAWEPSSKHLRLVFGVQRCFAWQIPRGCLGQCRRATLSFPGCVDSSFGGRAHSRPLLVEHLAQRCLPVISSEHAVLSGAGLVNVGRRLCQVRPQHVQRGCKPLGATGRNVRKPGACGRVLHSRLQVALRTGTSSRKQSGQTWTRVGGRGACSAAHLFCFGEAPLIKRALKLYDPLLKGCQSARNVRLPTPNGC